MKKVPFNVSARTARLIGRENVSSAEGALIELVKNSYDADASYCIVYFDDSYTELPKTTTKAHIDHLAEITNNTEIAHCYQQDLFGEEWKFSEEIYNNILTKEQRSTLEELLSKTTKIYILDDGDGMHEDTIEKSWMTIGTDNKFNNYLSEKSGRIKSGAKGIGRFALDRLGEKCSLLTKTISSESTLVWQVNWSDFDQQGATIDKINAELGRSSTSLENNLKSVLGDKLSIFDISDEAKGTHIEISAPRDVWKRGNIERIYLELESLVPPSEAGGFSIFLFSSAYHNDFGKIEPTTCEDYDYKLHVSMNNEGDMNFKINRHEIDQEKITEKLLARNYFKDNRITREQLSNETFTFNKKLSELLPGITQHKDDIHKAIGPFDFTLYFLKRQSERSDIKTFLHRHYNSSARKKWLEHNSGIRIYRDNFRVRPYGEIGKTSWDWLGLGRRAADDPSALRTGRWKVSPTNISGVINISRLNNLGLEDKSSREGIRENDAFLLFKSIIEAVVKEFESDRSGIYSEIYKYSDSLRDTPTDEHLNPAQEIDAETLAQKIFAAIRSKPLEEKDESSKLAVALLKAKARTREIDDQLEEMRRENSLLRVFASSGLTIAAFTHELDGLNAKLGGRFDKLEELLNAYLSMSDSEKSTIQSFKDPFKRIDMLRRDDERIKNWIKYSLRTIRKDKRNRKKINLGSYLENLRDEWNSTLIERQVELNVSVSSPSLSIKAYEIDLDCIFNNLIINSADAFKSAGFSGERRIKINASDDSESLIIRYRDSGPGLSPDITNPNDIFKATYSTKVNKQGLQVGTGLGMWLVKKTLEEYNGKANLINDDGFSLDMEIKK